MRISDWSSDVCSSDLPYTDEVIGTVPAGTATHAREAFEIAARYQPKLTRYERQQILLNTAELLVARRDEISDLVTLQLGISKADSLSRVGRAYDVFTPAGQLCIQENVRSSCRGEVVR